MKTDDLIALMSESARPVDTGWLDRATWLCALAALAATAGLVLFTLGARLDFGTAWASGPVIAKAARTTNTVATAVNKNTSKRASARVSVEGGAPAS